MSLVIIGAGGTGTINSSGTGTVDILALGTLDIVGTALNPIDVTLASVLGTNALDTINMMDAAVTLQGVSGISALTAYNIGQGATLRLASTTGVTAGSTVTFTGANSELALGNGIDLSLFNPIDGFGPGSSIDVTGAAARASYADASGDNTGGTLRLLDANNNVVATLPLGTGNFIDGNFKLVPDGSGGTLVQYATAVTSVTTTPQDGDLTTGQSVVLRINTTDPVTVSGGTPSLALNSGGVSTYSAADSTPTSLAFV